MKNFYLLIACVACAMFVSCSGSSSEETTPTKTITPTSNEFMRGQLARYIEIAADASDAEFDYIEKDGAIPSQYLRLKVTLEKVKSGFEDVDPRDIKFSYWGGHLATIDLVDENGTKIQSIRMRSDETLKFQKLITGPVHSKAEIVFEEEFHNSEAAPKWFESITQFTPYATADIATNF